MAALPGLSFLHALVHVPGLDGRLERAPRRRRRRLALSYSMLRRWGFGSTRSRSARRRHGGLERLRERRLRRRRGRRCSPPSGESHPLLTTAALDRHGAAGGGDRAVRGRAARRGQRPPRRQLRAERLWNSACAPRPPPAGVGLGRAAGGLPASRPSACCGAAGSRSRSATLAGHLTVFLVLLVSLRAVGVAARRRELRRGLRRLGADPHPHDDPDHAGRDRRRRARPDRRARLVRRAAAPRSSPPSCSTACSRSCPPIAIGGVCLLVWRRLGGAEPAPPTASPTVQEP